MTQTFNNSHPTPDVLAHVMPAWNGTESIVGYIIRQRREEKARVAAKRARRIMLARLVLWPLAALAAIYAAQALMMGV